MAPIKSDQKYQMLGPAKFAERRVYGVPWYQERVVEKMRREELATERKTKRKIPVSKMVDSSRWIFLKDGLDDFRDGLPPVVSDVFIKFKDNFPLSKGDRNKISSLKQPAERNRFTKDETCFSRTLPLVQRRRDNVNDVEQGLLAHRLALFPHLMESIPQDILEDVVTILDPEAAAAAAEADDYVGDERTKTDLTETDRENENHSSDVLTPLGNYPGNRLREFSAKGTESSYTPFSNPQEKNTPPSSASSVQRPHSSKNPYRWLYNRTAANANSSQRRDLGMAQRGGGETNVPFTVEKFRPASDGAERLASGNSDDGDGERYVAQVTKTFCDWVRGLGGEESNNIEESTILSLFAAGYETKPSLLVPIKVVELQNIPNELRVAAGVPPPSTDSKKTTKLGSKVHVDPNSLKTVNEVEELKEEERKMKSRANPDFGKMSFGAWYLPKKFWTKRDVEVPLEDPRDVNRKKETETFRRNIAIEKELAQLSGSKSFSDFLRKKSRKPEFMQRVTEIMERIELDGENGNNQGRQLPAGRMANPDTAEMN